MRIVMVAVFLMLSVTVSAARTSADLANDLSNNIDAANDNSVPVGAVVAWPYNEMPADGKWAECNGQTVNGIKTPDYRGMFLRGLGGNSASLGTEQGDAIRNITGRISGSPHPGAVDAYAEFFGDDVVSASGVFQMSNYRNQFGVGNVNEATGSRPHAFSIDASRQVPTANENRPVNKAVKYIMKVKR